MVEGAHPAVDGPVDAVDPVAGWAASGAMALTGHTDGPPLSPAAAVVPALTDLAAELARLAGVPVDLDVAQLVTGRAGLLGLSRRGRVSASGSCRLLPTADGWAAVNLARPSDVEAIPALVERTIDGDPWSALARGLERITGAALVDRATLLGLPAAVLPPRPTALAGSGAPGRPGAPRSADSDAPGRPGAPRSAGNPGGAGSAGFRLRQVGPAGRPGDEARRAGGRRERRPLVVDLSAMWAGPLCARLLGSAGMRVVKVEAIGRPDGARAGDARFFDWLHGGHESVALDLASPGGRAALARLVAAADVVVESSRPRALAQLGVDAEAVVAARPGTTWVSITGYGRAGPAGQRVAFGDDAAAAAGLVAHDDEGGPVFCGDAIADPITGLTAAVGALTSVAAGGGHLVEVPMVEAVAATLAVSVPPATAMAAPAPGGGWQVTTATGVHPVVPPRPLPPAPVAARPLGADTAELLRALATTC